METLARSQLLNAETFDQLASPAMQKQALDAVNDFTRSRMRESGFYGKILPPLTITNDELDRQVGTDKPYKVVDKEPDSPAAQSIPFGTLPSNVYIKGPRYPVMFDRIVTPNFMKDVDELRTWNMDIRQVVSDNAIKDMLAEEDGKFIKSVNDFLIARDTPLPWSGVAQWVAIDGGITRDTLTDAFKVMLTTDASLEPETVLINHITYKDLQKFTRNEMGGDWSQSVLKDGAIDENFGNKRWVVTIKKKLVPTNTMYMFAGPKFLGKSLTLEETTMYIEKRAFMIEFFAYQTKGGSIGNSAALARVDFR